MPDSARELCWRQFDAFATAGPYEQATAKLALQPLINLGRLHTRDGHGNAAYRVHHSMFQAAKALTTASIDGREVDLARVVRSGDDHQAVVQWLWTVLLADGLRARCRAGRWSEVLAQAEQHRGIGERLFDGRQIAIVAHSAVGDHAEALRLIDTTTASTVWEQTVAACLTVLCRTWAGQPALSETAAMREAYLRLEPDPGHTVFHIRLGLTAASLTSDARDLRSIGRTIERIVVEAADAYAAQDILALGGQLPLAEHSASVLRETVRAASLGTTVPPQLLDDLILAVRGAEQEIIAALHSC
ncbi:MAG: hypothetical protein HKP61_05365 [Dactylosporangium sp.]|nr:hypothetical protein [Dactylosporangium sp.]NNJ60376.1 hypothetical protein [Dactylosporangium sp.]